METGIQVEEVGEDIGLVVYAVGLLKNYNIMTHKILGTIVFFYRVNLFRNLNFFQN